MRLPSILLLLFGFASLSEQAPKTVTMEDVRDALLHVVSLIRQSEDKLERHEFRERQLGEQVKKSLVILDKRLKTMEPLRGTVMRLDERIAAIETILIKKNEKDDEQLQKTMDTVDEIKKNLPGMIEKVKNDIVKKLEDVQKSTTAAAAAAAKPSPSANQTTKNDLKTLRNDLKRDTDELKASLKALSNDFSRLKDESSKFNEINEKSSDSLMEKVKRQLSESEHLLAKYENKLAEVSNKIPATLSIPVPNYKEQKEMQNNVLHALDLQKTKVDQMMAHIVNISQKIDAVPHKISLDITKNNNNHKSNNTEIVEDLKRELSNESDKTLNLVDDKLRQIQYDNKDNFNELMKAIGDLKSTEVVLQKTIETDFASISKDIKDLSRFEEVLLQSANGVLDTKRRIEYGVHQIILETEELFKTYVKELNSSISERFDNFEMNVLDEENGALTNLTSKIGEEIDQVWRQIGIMHQQMTLNADTLNKLQNQTDVYVNGSLNVMDSMTGKVGHITRKMSEVDENLNYLLGRLSLITQEFNMIKTGLGKALDQIKSSFMEVQNKLNESNGNKLPPVDKGPGPHNITEVDAV